MRVFLPMAAFVLIAATAQAQNTTPVTPAPQGATPQEFNAAPGAPATGQTAPAHRRRQTMQQHFEAANTTHDGHLTPEQAQAGFPSVAKHFDAIDKDHKGYVTVDDIRAYRHEMRQHRHAKPAGTTQQ